jgi:hypothetical protein
MLWMFWTFLFSFFALQAAPDFVYLCLTDDPSHSMSVHWVGNGEKLFIDQEAMEPQQIPIPGSNNKMLKRLLLTGLNPDHEYTFLIDGEHFTFKTISDTLERVRFVIGGDLYHNYDRFRAMNQTVAALNPNFVVLGGDIAYAFDFRPWFKNVQHQWEKWETFFRCWCEQMRDQSGHLIPMVVTVGNHDAKGNYGTDIAHKTLTPDLFYTFFPFRESFIPYQKVIIAHDLALVLLDSGHTHPIDGKQAAWLAETLEEVQTLPYKMAVYHVPAYPSNQPFTAKVPERIRKHWSPIFEKYGVQAAFEHHNHAYKRTHPQNGVIYLGDGSWGVKPRWAASPKQRHYIAKSASSNAVFLITFNEMHCQIETVDIRGDRIDMLSLPHR